MFSRTFAESHKIAPIWISGAPTGSLCCFLFLVGTYVVVCTWKSQSIRCACQATLPQRFSKCHLIESLDTSWQQGCFLQQKLAATHSIPGCNGCVRRGSGTYSVDCGWGISWKTKLRAWRNEAQNWITSTQCQCCPLCKINRVPSPKELIPLCGNHCFPHW